MKTKSTKAQKVASGPFHTDSKRMSMAIPQVMRNLTAKEIVKVAWSTGRKEVSFFQQVMRNAMETYQDPTYWKNPFYAIEPLDRDGRDASQVLIAAIEWFHGAEAHLTDAGVIHSYGYACD